MKSLYKALPALLSVSLMLLAMACIGGGKPSYYCDDECCYSCSGNDCVVDQCGNVNNPDDPGVIDDGNDVTPNGTELPTGLCAPCAVDEDCVSGAICLENFDNGEMFCATPCDGSCVEGFTCYGLEEDADGGPFQCVPDAGSCDGLYTEPTEDTEDTEVPDVVEDQPTRPGEVVEDPVETTACVLDSDCADGLSCLDAECVALCFDDAECGAGFVCEDYLCVAAPEETFVPQCVSSDDCVEGAMCVNGICTILCASDADCPDGRTCVDNSCVH